MQEKNEQMSRYAYSVSLYLCKEASFLVFE